MRKLLNPMALCAVLLAGCGGGGGDGNKDLFSLWTRDGDGVPINLTGGALNTQFAVNTFDRDGSQCTCAMTFIGTQEGGSLIINQCRFVSSPVRDPGCSSRGGSGSYSKPGDILTLNGPSGTATFR